MFNENELQEFCIESELNAENDKHNQDLYVDEYVEKHCEVETFYLDRIMNVDNGFFMGQAQI